MDITRKAAAALSVLALGAVPALAIASPPPGHGHGKPVGSPGHGPHGTTGNTGATGTSGALGYTIKPGPPGQFCQGESKVHVPGMKGTPFSQCVTALAHLSHGKAKNPAQACKGLSKKHVHGTPGTPYSQCVSDAHKFLQSA